MDDELKLQVTAVVKNLQVHSETKDGVLWASRKLRLYVSRDDGKTWCSRGTLGRPGAKAVGKISLVNRLLRLGIHQIVPAGDHGLVAIADRAIYFSRDDGASFQCTHRLRHGRRPLRQGVSVTPDGGMFYGEYWANREREAVRIYRSPDGGVTWGTAFEFGAGEIRHIHAVQYDRFTGAMWVATGDSDLESRIGFSVDGGRTFHFIGGGSQIWRAVSLAFTEDSVIWGTDNPDGLNHIMRWKRSDGCLDWIEPVLGPVYYSRQLGSYILFSTACETRKDEDDAFARVYCVKDQLGVHEWKAFRKDRWHPTLFGYGVIEFSTASDDSGCCWMTAKGVKGGMLSLRVALTDDQIDL